MRFLISLVVLLVSVASAAAQTGVLKDPKPVRGIIQVLASGDEVAGIEQIPADLMYKGPVDVTDRFAAMNAVLAATAPELEIAYTDGILQVRAKQSGRSAAIRPAALYQPGTDQPPLPQRTGFQGIAMTESLPAMNYGPPLPQRTGAYPGYGYDYGGYGADYDFVQRHIDQNNWAAIRFKKGRERFMENVEVYGCGQRLASADEGNNIWDNRVLVPTTCHPLTFRYSDGQSDWEVEIDEMLPPLRLGQTKTLSLDENFFQRARVVRERVRYSLVEQADGSFKKVVRK